MSHEHCSPTYDWIACGDGIKVWSYVLSIGRLHPLTAKAQEISNDKLIIVIPGNPGHCKFMETFATHLHQHDPASTSVWVVSHVGHVRVPGELASRAGSTTMFDSKYVALQTRHKMDFLLTFVPKNAFVILIGHSVGSYITLETLDSMEKNGMNVAKAFLLFPTIERVRETPNGRAMLKMRSFGAHRILDTILPALFYLLPEMMKKKLIEWRCRRHRNSIGPHAKPDRNVIDAAVDLLHGAVVKQAIEMAYDEFENIYLVNDVAMHRYGHKLVIIYAAKDGWCPLTYRDELLNKWPQVKTIVCDDDSVEHAFVIYENRLVADLVLGNM